RLQPRTTFKLDDLVVHCRRAASSQRAEFLNDSAEVRPLRPLFPGRRRDAPSTTQAMKIALYARTSTTDPNCEMQLRELREYCQRRGWNIYQEYVDTWAGSKAIRPQRSNLMADAAMRRFDTVLVWRLDRWGRSLAD